MNTFRKVITAVALVAAAATASSPAFAKPKCKVRLLSVSYQWVTVWNSNSGSHKVCQRTAEFIDANCNRVTHIENRPGFVCKSRASN